MSFLIIGLPRSRTAWLSNFMTYDGIYCHHEAINGCHSIEEYKKKIGSDGDSSTGTMLFDPNNTFPDRKILVIDSTPDKAIAFMKSKYGIDNPQWIYYLKEKLDSISGLHIDVNEINDNLKTIWEYLAESEYDEKRSEMLKSLNVQTNEYDVDLHAARSILGDIQES